MLTGAIAIDLPSSGHGADLGGSGLHVVVFVIIISGGDYAEAPLDQSRVEFSRPSHRPLQRERCIP